MIRLSSHVRYWTRAALVMKRVCSTTVKRQQPFACYNIKRSVLTFEQLHSVWQFSWNDFVAGINIYIYICIYIYIMKHDLSFVRTTYQFHFVDVNSQGLFPVNLCYTHFVFSSSWPLGTLRPIYRKGVNLPSRCPILYLFNKYPYWIF